VVPLLGFGVVRDGDWGSAGLETAVELEYGRRDWRWSGYASVRGIGVGCSHDCFDGGSALALGALRSVGALWLGGGAEVMRQRDSTRLTAYARLSIDAAAFRVDVRVEAQPAEGAGVYIPILVGIPIPLG
jgi:hypothetical protein